MATLYNELDLSNASAELQNLILGAQETPTFNASAVVDAILAESEDDETLMVLFNTTGGVNAVARLSEVAPGDLQAFMDYIRTSPSQPPVEVFTVPGADLGLKTVTFQTQERTRTVTNEDGSSPINNVVDATLPRISLATLLNRLEVVAFESYSNMEVIVSQLSWDGNPGVVLAGGEGMAQANALGVPGTITDNADWALVDRVVIPATTSGAGGDETPFE